MSTAQIWTNIISYALQIGLLVGLGALAPPLLRLRTPHARLLFWQALLVACLILPCVQPWRQEVITASNVSALTAPESAAGAMPMSPAAAGISPVTHRSIPFASIILVVLAAGVIVRLAWLGAGLVKLTGYRHRGHELASDPVFKIATAVGARWLVSDEIPGPVTFGWRDPVVLLPARFPLLRAELREAILCHELVHVERRDWIFTLAEEIIRAVFWFHPAVWWVLGEIRLAREQTVDRTVIEITREREPYIDALLAMSGAPGRLDLSPAPLFLRKRHLKQRLAGLLQEVRTLPPSKMVLFLTNAGATATIAAACWVASGLFPLSAAPQLVTDDVGVTVNTGDAKLVRRTPVAYPPEALERGVEGRIVIQTRVDADGSVSGDTVVRCPRELCNAAVDSLPHWQFDAREANTTRDISIDFVKPAWASKADDEQADLDFARAFAAQLRKAQPLLAQVLKPVAPGLMASPVVAQAPRAVPTFLSRTVWMDGEYVSIAPPASASVLGQNLKDVRIGGLSDTESAQLSSRLPVRAGDVWSAATASIVRQVVTGFNPQLEVDVVDHIRPREFSLWIGPAEPAHNKSVITWPPLPPGVYMAAPGEGISPPVVLSKVDPAFTDLAKSARISGTVTLLVVVAADGAPQDIQVIGPLDPGLDQASADALAKWRFRPGAKDGAPVSTQAQVVMEFRML